MMRHVFHLEYWLDEGWYVGRLQEVPGVFSQGETMDELIGNIRDAYQLMMEEEPRFEIGNTDVTEVEIEG